MLDSPGLAIISISPSVLTQIHFSFEILFCLSAGDRYQIIVGKFDCNLNHVLDSCEIQTIKHRVSFHCYPRRRRPSSSSFLHLFHFILFFCLRQTYLQSARFFSRPTNPQTHTHIVMN